MNDSQTNQNNENSPLGQVPQQANQLVEPQAITSQPTPTQEFASQANIPQTANPQQTMTPQPSQAPPVNNGSVIATPVVPQPKKSMNKGLLFGIIGGVIALIAVALILIFVVFAKPSMSDYAEARTKLSSIADFYSKIDRVSYSSFL